MIKHLQGRSPEDIIKSMEPDEALRWASSNGHTKIVKYMLNTGENVHERDE